MPKQSQRAHDEKGKRALLQALNRLGEKVWQQEWQNHIAFPSMLDFTIEKEASLRFLLFRALMNQQGVTEFIRLLCQRLCERFWPDIVMNPASVEQRFAKVVEEYNLVDEKTVVSFRARGEKARHLYSVARLGGIKSLSLFLYRFAAFSFFIQSEVEGQHANSLYGWVKKLLHSSDGVMRLLAEFRDHPILAGGWVGNDPKACRMFVDWTLWMFLHVWGEQLPVSMQDSLMIVDGHVAKVFARTGFLSQVRHEKDLPRVEAFRMRDEIEQAVRAIGGVVPFFVDHGAFVITEGYAAKEVWCTDYDPDCPNCPMRDYCLRHTKWTAIGVAR